MQLSEQRPASKIAGFDNRIESISSSSLPNSYKVLLLHKRSSMFRVLHLPHVLHKRLLVHHAGIPPVLDGADIAQAQLGKAFVHEVHGRLEIQTNWCLQPVVLAQNDSTRSTH